MAKKNNKQKGDCVTTDTLVYSWFMPELFLAAYWAGEDWFCRFMNTSQSVEEKIKGLGEILFGENAKREDMFIFDKVVEAVFRGSVSVEGIGVKSQLFKDFKEVQKLNERIMDERPDDLITGTPMIGTKWDLAEYIQATLFDLIEKHISDLNRIMGEHYDGGVQYNIGSTFVLKTSEQVLWCELENLVFSGSVFNCNGVEVRMLPILISE